MRHFALATTLLLCATQAHALPWMRTYSESSIVAESSSPFTDGSGVLVAAQHTGAGGVLDIALAKVLSDGTLAFQKVYRCNAAVHLQSPRVVALSDGGAVLAANGQSDCGGPLGSGYNIIVIRLNAGGTMAWSRVLYTMETDYVQAITPTADGGFAITGFAGTSNIDAYVTKLNSSGGVVWNRRFGKGTNDILYSITESQEGSTNFLVAAGTTNTRLTSNQDIWAIKLTSTGATVGSLSYDIVKTGVSGNEELHSVTYVGGTQPAYLAAGWTTNSLDTDGVVVKIRSSDAGLALGKTYVNPMSATPELFRSIRRNPDTTMIVAGETSGFGAVANDGWLVKLDPLGAVSWGKRYGDSSNDRLFAVEPIVGGYFAGGTAPSFGGLPNMFVIRADSTGEVTPSCPFDNNAHPAVGTHTFVGPYIINDNGDSGFTVGDAIIKEDPLTLTPSLQCG